MDTVADRVFLERLVSKLLADYNEIAAGRAVLVARGKLAPLNLIEVQDAQIFVYNNVFFPFSADNVNAFTSESSDEAARVASEKDVSSVCSWTSWAMTACIQNASPYPTSSEL